MFVDCTKQVCSFDGNVKKLLDKFEIADNLAVNTTGAADDKAKAVDVKGFTNLSGTADKPIDLGLDDVAAQDFSSHWQAWIQKEMPSFETIPFEKIGLVPGRVSPHAAGPLKFSTPTSSTDGDFMPQAVDRRISR